MNDKKKSKSAAPKPKGVSKTKKSDGSGKNLATKTRKTGAKTKEPSAKTRKRKVKVEDAAGYRAGDTIVDPLGDESSGEPRTYLGDAEFLAHAETEAFQGKAAADAVDTGLEAAPELAVAGTRAAKAAGVEAPGNGDEAETVAEPHPSAKLERLQKILSQAGIASRRHAEEMIVAGRVMVNGQVVTQLGSKADPARDHIRVDGKLLQGAERHRYFLLNKPRGYVTTVSDPEGRPTVMDFVAKARERLYPVGRLDYQSEGLLLMTNDGELANLLTKAGSCVEKTYLVKVAGQPSEEELERLRGGVAMERGEAGSARVRTAPARIRPVREGDNPWYEVVLIEGRNRELRKMFSAVGHFVEKIRRVGYGPLVLDVEPGKLRELRPDEVSALRLTAEGKLKPRRIRADQMLSAEAGRVPEMRGAREDRPRWQRDNRPKKTEWRPREREFHGRQSGEGQSGESRTGEFRSRKFRGGAKSGFDMRGGERFGAKPGFDRPRSGRPFSAAKPRFERQAFDAKPHFERPAGKPGRFGGSSRPKFGAERPFRGERPYFKRDGGPEKRFEKAPKKSFGARPGKNWTERPRTEAHGASGKNKGAAGGRYESRGGAKGSGFSKGRNFSKTGNKGTGFRGTFGGSKRGGFRPPGKPDGGMKRA